MVGHGGWPRGSRGVVTRRKAWLISGGAAVLAIAAAALTALGPGTAGASTGSAPPAGQATAAGHWQVVKSLPAHQLSGFSSLVMTSTNSGWAFENTGGKADITAWQLNGTTWAKQPFPVATGSVAVQATSPDNVWAFTTGEALQWNGADWTVMRRFAEPSHSITGELVVSPTDVWVWTAHGAVRYSGTTWTSVPAGNNLSAVSALSPDSIWGVGYRSVEHWNGTVWHSTSLAHLLPKSTATCGSYLTAIYAASPTKVWVAATGGCEDFLGPFVLLHYDGQKWEKVRELPNQGRSYQVSPDGRGGLWIEACIGDGGGCALIHYSDHDFAVAKLPIGKDGIVIDGISTVPHTGITYIAGQTYKFVGLPTGPVIMRYGP
jgi:hypothetical protein